MDNTLREKLKNIKLLACDFDGVMTDGKAYVCQNGAEMVRVSRKDGMGVGMLQKNGVKVVVISTESNPVVKRRCEKIKVDCWQNIGSAKGKLEILKNRVEEMGIEKDAVAFVGDDINDIEALKFAGVAFTVADGHRRVRESADYITRAKGGDHAVREICELILEAKEIPLKY